MARHVLGQGPGSALLVLVLGLTIPAATIARAAPPVPKAAPTAPIAPAIYVIDLLATGALPADVTQKIKPLNTLQAVEDLLKANSVPFAWRRFEANSQTMDQGFAQQLAALPPKEVFVLPHGDGWYIGVIIGSR
jgi:hypothetical protein